MKTKLADIVKNETNRQKGIAPHLVVIARAGTGKTTTLVEGLRLVVGGDPSQLTPSPQQEAVWEAMAQDADDDCAPETVCFVAFNKSIASELADRVPAGCSAMTMHSMGYKAVRQAFKINGAPDSWRVVNIISELTETDSRELRKTKPTLLRATEQLVKLCKMNLVGQWADNGDFDWPDALSALASHYDVELNSSAESIFELVPRVLERCKDVDKDGRIDFDDMIWLPIALGLPLTKYDLLLVDEAQDLNRCQQELARRSGDRLILCGDPKQAIYGFAGADAESMPRMTAELSDTERGCVELPLTVTYRCGKAIVKEANKLVDDFEAFETNCAGSVGDTRMEGPNGYRNQAGNGDMILCRVNAPLVSQCFKFLREGKKANIQGRDVGKGLITTVKKLKASDVADLSFKLSEWFSVETKKEASKRQPNEGRLIALQDKFDCLECFIEDQETIDAVVAKIESVFTDDKSGRGVMLSSVHKAKGLEARCVFILLPAKGGMPHPMAKSKWQVEQEYNLMYVAQTRAIAELWYVREKVV